MVALKGRARTEKTQDTAKGGKPLGHWVTVEGRPLFLRGKPGHETAADRAANARTLKGGGGKADSGGKTLRDRIADHKQAKASEPTAHAGNYFARRKAEGHAPPPGKHGDRGSHSAAPTRTPAAHAAPKKPALKERIAEHKGKKSPDKPASRPTSPPVAKGTEKHADTQWERGKAHQAKGEHKEAEKAFTRHDALMTRVARRTEGKAEGRPSLKEVAAAHKAAKAEAEKSAARVPSSHTDHAPGHVGELDTKLIHFDPDRFQYKLAAQGSHGVTDALHGVKHYDPNLGGVLQVWKDPANGKVFVVNGHHRLDLANKLGAEKVAVRFLGSKTAEEARGVGALTNIAEGRGSSLDAAKFFRDTGHDRAGIEAKGVPLKEKVATEGLALANLHEPIFKRVVNQEMTPARGAIIGHGTTHAQQKAIVKGIDKLPKSRQPSDATLRNSVEDSKLAPTKTVTSKGLFGDDEEDFSLGLHRGELAAHVQDRLGSEKRLFGVVSKAKNAAQLKEKGNVIDTEGSAGTSAAASQNLMTFNLLRKSKSPVSDLLNEGAERIHKGEKKKAVHDDIYKRLPAAVQAALSGG